MLVICKSKASKSGEAFFQVNECSNYKSFNVYRIPLKKNADVFN